MKKNDIIFFNIYQIFEIKCLAQGIFALVIHYDNFFYQKEDAITNN